MVFDPQCHSYVPQIEPRWLISGQYFCSQECARSSIYLARRLQDFLVHARQSRRWTSPARHRLDGTRAHHVRRDFARSQSTDARALASAD